MTTYGLKSNIRKKVLLWICVISLIIGSILYPLFSNVMDNICRQCPSIKEFICKWEYLGVFSTQLTVITIFGLITWIFNNYLWKTKLFLKILKIPNLNGVWEGVLESSYTDSDSRQRVKVEMVVTITQTWEKMVCRSKFPKSESSSDIICLDTESSQGIVLKFTYINQSQDLKCDLPEFSGYNELRLQDENTLSGTYFTKRVPSTRGIILLIRRNPSSNINENVTGHATI